MKCTIIGITGGTGSGKSTFTNRLKMNFRTMWQLFIMTIITGVRMLFPLKREKSEL